MCTGSTSAPKPPPKAPEPAQAPVNPNESAGARSRADTQRRRGASKGDTILTGARGLNQPATTQQSTLLGG